MIKPICKDQNLLAKPARPATKQDLKIAQDLLDTLAANAQNCVGMAANMIGIPVAIIAVSLGPVNIAMINPEIIAKAKPYQTKEGCLSLIGQRPTTRFQEITVSYYDLSWQKQTLNLSDFAAQIVQHEVDHCHGIII